MSDDKSLESKTGQKKLKHISKFDKRFLVITVFLLLSVVAVVFAPKYLFDKSFDNWTVTYGKFEVDDGLAAKYDFNNIAYCTSLVAYGQWEWEVRYYGAGSASIIFIGSEPDLSIYNLSTKGYKLQFEITKPLALLRIDDKEAFVELNSTYFVPEAGERYKVKITRALNNTFIVYINDQLKFKAFDSTYNTSKIFQLDWYRTHNLLSVKVTDNLGKNSWFDAFTRLPKMNSSNLFTRISLFLPFSVLSLIFIFYLFGLLFSDGNMNRIFFPLLLAVIIGTGYGFLAKYFVQNTPTEIIEPDPTPTETFTISPTGNETGPTYPTGPTPTPPISPTGSPDYTEVFTGIPKDVVSLTLLIISGIFILLAMVFIGIDFFKKRDEEFHKRIIDQERRWTPAATETDYRKRVIRAYHGTAYELIDAGAKSERSMTPGEFEKKTIEKFPKTGNSLSILTDLYEEARYSDHDISKEVSEKAELSSSKISKQIKTSSTVKKVFNDEEPNGGKKDNE